MADAPPAVPRRTLTTAMPVRPVTLVLAALDDFGVECLDLFHETSAALLGDVQPHYFWFGPGEPPVRQPAFWQHRASEFFAGQPFRDFPTIKGPGADSNLSPMHEAATTGLHQLHDLFRPSDGNWSDGAMLVTLVGSALEETTMERLSAIVEAYLKPECRNLWGSYRLSALVSLFPQSNTKLKSQDVPRASAFAGAALLRVQQRLTESHRRYADYKLLTPVYLSGDIDSLDDRELPRRDAVAILTLALAGQARCYARQQYENLGLHNAEYVGDHRSSQWLFFASAEQGGVSGKPFIGSKPIAVLGGVAAICRRVPWLSALAAQLADQLFRTLGEQPDPSSKPDESWGPKPRATDEARRDARIANAKSGALEGFGDEIGRYGFVAGSAAPLSRSWFESVLGWETRVGIWREKVEPLFGWSRIEPQALEDYEHCLKELRDLMEGHFTRDRERRSGAFAYAGLAALDAAISRAIDGGCEQWWDAITDFQPHLLARGAMGGLEKDFKSAAQDCRTKFSQEGLDSPTVEESTAAPVWLEGQYQRLLETVRSAPSALALWARIGMVFAFFLTIVPVARAAGWIQLQHLGLSPRQEVLASVGIAVLAGGIFGLFCAVHLYGTRKRIREAFKRWYDSALDKYYRVETNRSLRRWGGIILTAADHYWRWLRESTTPNPPSFSEWVRVHADDDAALQAIFSARSCNLGASAKPRFLHQYPADLATARQHFTRLTEIISGYLKSSKHLVHLPEWHTPDQGCRVIEDRFKEMFPATVSSDAHRRREALRDVLARTADSVPVGSTDSAMLWNKRRAGAGTTGRWRGDHEMPVTPDQTLSQPSLTWFATLRDTYLARLSELYRVRDQIVIEPSAQHPQSLVHDMHTSAGAKPSVAVPAAEQREVWVPERGDLTEGIERDHSVRIRELGPRGYYAVVSAAGGFSVEDVLQHDGGTPHTPLAFDVKMHPSSEPPPSRPTDG